MRKLTTYLFCLLSVSIQAQEKIKSSTSLDSVQHIDEVLIKSTVLFGNKLIAQNRTGSAYYISPTELKKMGYIDINRVLKTVPGITIVEEEGFGLRPNISLRGTSRNAVPKLV